MRNGEKEEERGREGRRRWRRVERYAGGNFFSYVLFLDSLLVPCHGVYHLNGGRNLVLVERKFSQASFEKIGKGQQAQCMSSGGRVKHNDAVLHRLHAPAERDERQKEEGERRHTKNGWWKAERTSALLSPALVFLPYTLGMTDRSAFRKRGRVPLLSLSFCRYVQSKILLFLVDSVCPSLSFCLERSKEEKRRSAP